MSFSYLKYDVFMREQITCSCLSEIDFPKIFRRSINRAMSFDAVQAGPDPNGAGPGTAGADLNGAGFGTAGADPNGAGPGTARVWKQQRTGVLMQCSASRAGS